MSGKLSKFYAFVLSRFPSEVAYVMGHHEMQDPELVGILHEMEKMVSWPAKDAHFSEEIDSRKYSRMIGNFNRKLESIDVDAYYEWIARISYQITTDAIPPEEQSRILRELEGFNPGWYHAESFYRAMESYEAYLLIRYREKDFQSVSQFLDTYREEISKQVEIDRELHAITRKMVFGAGGASKMDPDQLQWLLDVFYNELYSKKLRYRAWVAYNLHHISSRKIDALLKPLATLEKFIFQGDFYSRRILANFYANKLLVLNYLGKYEEAAWCGHQSIKHHTEDFLYYLNNYTSVLIHLEKDEEAVSHMLAAFPIYKKSQDNGRRLIFVTNYARCLNRLGRFRPGARASQSFLDEMGKNIFQYRWNYFFRIYLAALLRLGHPERLLRLDRKYKLADRERKSAYTPYIQALLVRAAFLEMKITEEELKDRIAELLKSAREAGFLDFGEWVHQMKLKG